MDILLVEDNSGDARLVAEALRESGRESRLHVVEDGVEAMRFLRRDEPYTGAVRPDLVLLDLNLPRKDGREVLADLKTDPSLKRIPVVVFTTSAAEPDILRCYELHANCFVSKPVDLDGFLGVVRHVENYWRDVAQLPPA